jgi:hypothetical protein
VPHDFASGKPFVYQPSAEGGYRLYSVGMNMRDDGGDDDREKDHDDIVVISQ